MPLLQQATKVSTPLARLPRMDEYIAYRQGGGAESFAAWKAATPEAVITYQWPAMTEEGAAIAAAWGYDTTPTLPGEAPRNNSSTSGGDSFGGFGGYESFDAATYNRHMQSFADNDSWHMLGYAGVELDPDDLMYVQYTVPGESTPRTVLKGMVPAYDAFYSGRITQDQLNGLALNLTPVSGNADRSFMAEIIPGIFSAVLDWAIPGAGRLLNILRATQDYVNTDQDFDFSTLLPSASGLGPLGGENGGGGSSNYTGEGSVDTSGGGGNLLTLAINMGRAINNGLGSGAVSTTGMYDPAVALEGAVATNTGADSDDQGWQQDWWKDLGYPSGPQGLLDAREDGWRKSDTDTDPVQNENDMYGDGLTRHRRYRDPITGEVRRIDDRNTIDALGPFRIPWEIAAAGGTALWDWVSRNNDHISRESVFRREEPTVEEPPERQAPILGPAPRVDEDGNVIADEEGPSVFQPPVITAPITGPEPPRGGDVEEPEKLEPPGVVIPQLGEPPTGPGGGDDEEPERREPPLILQPITGPTPPRADDEFDWDEWERQRREDEERRRANIGGRVDLGTTGNKLKYREGYSGFAGGETGRSVFSGPGRYNNPFTNRGSSS